MHRHLQSCCHTNHIRYLPRTKAVSACSPKSCKRASKRRWRMRQRRPSWNIMVQGVGLLFHMARLGRLPRHQGNRDPCAPFLRTTHREHIGMPAFSRPWSNHTRQTATIASLSGPFLCQQARREKWRCFSSMACTSSRQCNCATRWRWSSTTAEWQRLPRCAQLAPLCATMPKLPLGRLLLCSAPHLHATTRLQPQLPVAVLRVTTPLLRHRFLCADSHWWHGQPQGSHQTVK